MGVMAAEHAAEQGEQQLVMQFAEAFGLPEAELTPHFRTLVAKNDRAVLDRAVGAARAREDGKNMNLPAQVDAFLQQHGGVAAPDGLYVIEMGGNFAERNYVPQQNAEAQALAKRVTIEVDTGFTSAFPAKQGAADVLQLETELAGDLEQAVTEAFARVHAELEDAQAFSAEVREDDFRSRRVA